MDDKLQQRHEQVLAVARTRHPSIQALLEENGVIDPKPATRDLLTFLARVLVSQLISTKAADSIWQRIADLADQNGGLASVLIEQNRDSLLACGLSRTKAKALILMNQDHSEGRISGDAIRQADYDQVQQQVTSLFGYGRWSADMAALFYAELPDVWPLGDGALLRAVQLLIPDEDPEEAGAFYRPNRSYLTHQIYRGINDGSLL